MEITPAIDVNHVSKVYRLYEKPYYRILDALSIGGPKYTEHAALKDVSFQIGRGECVGIIGTNGSGKSTILKIITGVVKPTEGTVKVDGRISALLELGAGFNMEYNGIENVYLNGTMLGFSEEEIKEKLPSILDFADIGGYVYQPVKTYSSGMFVRLAFAVAINIDPEILIVDEALSVGDVFFQAKCYHKFEEFKEMGKTIVFVSHDLSSIQKYCDRVILLNQGDKLGEGTAKEMIDAYKQVLVGQYQPEEKTESLADDEQIRALAAQKAGVNPQLLEYGSGQAKIVDFYLTDEHGNRSNAILKGTDFVIHMRVEFYEDLAAPIFAFSFKNIRGTEITGTNSMVEKAFLEPVKAGDVKEATFTQKMSLQGGEYLLSLGLTGFVGDEFQVYHRLYDIINVTVVSEKDTVGYYDMDSKVEVRDAATLNPTDGIHGMPKTSPGGIYGTPKASLGEKGR